MHEVHGVHGGMGGCRSVGAHGWSAGGGGCIRGAWLSEEGDTGQVGAGGDMEGAGGLPGV